MPQENLSGSGPTNPDESRRRRELSSPPSRSQPEPPPRRRPLPQGYSGFLHVLDQTVESWSQTNRDNENEWSPLEWQDEWTRVVTPAWWETQLVDPGGRENIQLVLTTVEPANLTNNIHHPSFVR